MSGTSYIDWGLQRSRRWLVVLGCDNELHSYLGKPWREGNIGENGAFAVFVAR